VRPLFEAADLVIGNLETPLCTGETPIQKTGANFRVDPRVAGALKELGGNAFTLCNNHIMDQGVQGLGETLAALDREDISRCGAAMTHEEACQPALFSVRGRSIGVLAFGEGEFAQAQENGPGAARLDPFWAEHHVQKLRGEVDIVR